MNKMQREWASQNIKVLTETFGLKSGINKMYSRGKIPLACVVNYVDGVLNSHGNVPAYEKVVRAFEVQYDVHVYYCISGRNVLTMLYVSSDEKTWKCMKPQSGERVLSAAVYKETYDFFDFGDVVLDVRDGVLIRVG